ncbi:MAG: CinA family protein [Verrucomicrobiota bacterium]|nr:CinA family protein [Verrucomicrobiota bacterium]
MTSSLGEERLERAIVRAAAERGVTYAFVESCTGGALAARIVSVEGASRSFLGSLVVYAEQWKEKFLHVRPETLQSASAVSRETVREMVEGIFKESTADYAVATSGWLSHSPSEIFIAVGKRGEEIHVGHFFLSSDRATGMEEGVDLALRALWQCMQR